MKKYWGQGIGLFLTGVINFAATEAAAEPIRIGVAAPLTGPLAPLGSEMREAASAVSDAINASGGLLGRRVEMVFRDDVCQPRRGVEVAQRFKRDRVAAVVGHCSKAAPAAARIYEEARIPFFAPFAARSDFRPIGHRFVFASGIEVARQLGQHVPLKVISQFNRMSLAAKLNPSFR